MKTRTSDNKPPKSGAIKKWSIPADEITRIAEELTRCKSTDSVSSTIRAYKTIVEKKAPKIEPVESWDYEIYTAYVKAHCKMHDTYETTGNELNKLFPQNKSTYDIVRNLKRSHGISYRRVENGRNDTYVFFVEPTREELIVQLTSAETKVIQYREQMKDFTQILVRKNDLIVENTQLKSDLSNSQRSNNILFRFAIWAVITIFIKSVAI